LATSVTGTVNRSRCCGTFAVDAVAVSGRHRIPIPDQIQRARDNGVTKDDIVEMIAHLAFYTGWPNAMTAIIIAKRMSMHTLAREMS
jgi:alkylhydroperoxidase/carboxymuconolactone decarboxylase family protein YurZ